MKKLLCMVVLISLVSCYGQHEMEMTRKVLQDSIAVYKDSVAMYKDSVAMYKDSVEYYKRDACELKEYINKLSYPSDQRYSEAEKLIKEDKLTEARSTIGELLVLFPKSDEANKCQALISAIEKKEKENIARQERLKALGFKAFPDVSTYKEGNKTVSFSGWSSSRTFDFGHCAEVGEYDYRTAGKNNTFIIANATLSTKDDYASFPSLWACKIDDGKLVWIASFREEYASWSGYGEKIGLYHEVAHDFSKVNSVRYRIAAEVTLEEYKNPIVVIALGKGHNSKDVLTPESLEECDVKVIRIINRNKL